MTPETKSVDVMQRHRGFRRMFAERRLTLGLFVPIESYQGSMPTMKDHAALVRRAEALGFAAIWVRDVPLYDPSFGDVGQIYDPWVYLGHLAALTDSIALATGSIVLPLRHPLHVAKAASSVDHLSGGRLVLGLASGDRPVEFPAFGVNAEERSERFRETFTVLRRTFPRYRQSRRIVARSGSCPQTIRRNRSNVHHRQQPPGLRMDRRAWRRMGHLPTVGCGAG